MEKGIFKGEGPIEAQMARVTCRQIIGLKNSLMVLNEAVTEGGPGEKVDSNWMPGAGL